MTQKLSKNELVGLVAKLLRAEGSEEETLQWLKLVEQNVPDPNVQGLIYWPSRYGLDDEPTAEKIVEKALSYHPIAL
jgi:hypothetical protein